jgi:hypothetical protein
VSREQLTAYGVAGVTIQVIRKALDRGFREGDRPLVW